MNYYKRANKAFAQIARKGTKRTLVQGELFPAKISHVVSQITLLRQSVGDEKNFIAFL